MEKIPERPGQPERAEDFGTVGQNDSRRVPQRTGVERFWVLGEPETSEADQRRAEWNKADKLDYQSIRCTIDPAGHRRAGNRITPLSVILPNLEPQDFVWSTFDCLVQTPVVQLFLESGFTGWEVAPAKAKFATSFREPPTLWQFLAKGSAGMISAASGYRVEKICPDCGLIDDGAKIEDPTKVVDELQWDGTDFFRVGRISGSIFITERVVGALQDSNFAGWKAYSLEEMKETFDIGVPGPSTRKWR